MGKKGKKSAKMKGLPVRSTQTGRKTAAALNKKTTKRKKGKLKEGATVKNKKKTKRTIPASKNKAKKKKRKNVSSAAKRHLTQSDINAMLKQLVEMKATVEKDIKKKKEFDVIEHDVGDMIDTANENVDKELFFGISSNEISLLNNIEMALRKIEKGSYGYCEICRKPIPKKRLKAIPQTRYCINCQTVSDKSSVT